MSRFPFIGSLLIGLAWPVAAGPLAGRVFLDANGNGRLDPGERGLPGCVVSDERTLARTDGEGRYRLDLPDGPSTVFVVNAPQTSPSGAWWVHRPDGSKAGTHDFALRAEKQEGVLYFVHGTDPHIRPEIMPLYRRYLDYVNALPVPLGFVVHTGDLVVDALRATPARAQSLFDQYTEANKALKPGLRNVLGNHDVVGVTNPQVREGEAGYGKAMFRERVGPVHYAFRWGGYHFVALDGTTIKGRNVQDGLTKESADWAIAYLSGVATNEAVVLLTHQPLYPEKDGWRLMEDVKERPHEHRLREAFKGRKLFLTLAGHVHDRTSEGWGGAPHFTAGAISSTWHGLLPYANNPRSCVLYRFEGLKAERLFLDWSEPVSIDIRDPNRNMVVVGRHQVGGAVPDFKNQLTGVVVALGGQRAEAKLRTAGHLAKTFAAPLDLTSLDDGVYDLTVTAQFGGQSHVERQPVVVYNARSARLETKTGAKLSFTLDGGGPKGAKVVFNNRPLTTLPAWTGRRTFTLDLPAERLRRLNEFQVQADDPGTFPGIQIKQVQIEHDGRKYRDVRRAPLARETLLPDRSRGTISFTGYVDLTYQDWEWSGN